MVVLYSLSMSMKVLLVMSVKKLAMLGVVVPETCGAKEPFPHKT